jgi:hypothetical protein
MRGNRSRCGWPMARSPAEWILPYSLCACCFCWGRCGRNRRHGTRRAASHREHVIVEPDSGVPRWGMERREEERERSRGRCMLVTTWEDDASAGCGKVRCAAATACSPSAPGARRGKGKDKYHVRDLWLNLLFSYSICSPERDTRRSLVVRTRRYRYVNFGYGISTISVALYYTGLMTNHFKLDGVSRMTYTLNGATLIAGPEPAAWCSSKYTYSMDSVGRIYQCIPRCTIMDLKKKPPTGPRAVLLYTNFPELRSPC